MEGTTLERTYPYRRFYINMEWSKDGTGEVLLQADDPVEEFQLSGNVQGPGGPGAGVI